MTISLICWNERDEWYFAHKLVGLVTGATSTDRITRPGMCVETDDWFTASSRDARSRNLQLCGGVRREKKYRCIG